MFGSGRNQEAEPILRRALVAQCEAGGRIPDTPAYRARQARVRAAWVPASGRRIPRPSPQCQEIPERSSPRRDQLVDQFPTEPGYRDLQTEILDGLAGALVRKDPQEAEKLFRRVLAIRPWGALAENRTSQWNRSAAASNQDNLANLYRAAGRLPEAEEAYRQAIAFLQKEATDFPNRLNCRSALGLYHVELGELLEATNRRDKAEQASRVAWAIATDKVSPEAQPQYFWSIGCPGQACLVKLPTAAGHTKEVEAHYRQAIVLWKKLATQSPPFPTTDYLVGTHATSDGRVPGSRQGTPRRPRSSPFEPSRCWRYPVGEAGSERPAHHKLRLCVQFIGLCTWPLLPNVKLREPKRAVDLAQKAIRWHQRRGIFGTRWASPTTPGNWKACLAALEKVPEFSPYATSWDWFFQAMAHWQLSDKDRAHKYYQQAVDWMDKNHPKNES